MAEESEFAISSLGPRLPGWVFTLTTLGKVRAESRMQRAVITSRK